MSYSVGFQSVGAGSIQQNYGNTNTSVNSQQDASVMSMDEAYRRLGHKLSQRVTSGEHYRAHVACNLGSHPSSAFDFQSRQHRQQHHHQQEQRLRYQQYQQQSSSIQQQEQQYPLTSGLRAQSEISARTHKVAKMGYSDHGSHQQQMRQQRPKSSILKKLTYNCKATFRAMEATKHSESPSKGAKKRTSPEEGGNGTNKGFLESALEEDEHKSTTSSTLESSKPRKCLTTPADPASNEGRDNAEGNLIVFEGDWISPQNVQTLRKQSSSSSASQSSSTSHLGRLQVIELLGQGTFAQVFLCKALDTGEQIALKVVKNKQAYTRQAAIEIDVFRALCDSKVNMVHLQCYFMHQNHLCLVFEQLGLNLYEVLKRRQFRGLPLSVVQPLVRQAIESVRDLSAKSIVHCDLKPENILLNSKKDYALIDGAINRASSLCEQSNGSARTSDTSPETDNDEYYSATSSASTMEHDVTPRIKLIDFGSACFEGHTTHTYIQSRFYRSPEVLVGLPYDSAIDMWSLGCVAAELFLGLPILPGVHEHDQLGRIAEMIRPLPGWMLEQGSKSLKYFSKVTTRANTPDYSAKHFSASDHTPATIAEVQSQKSQQKQQPKSMNWRIKTQQEYINTLSASEIRKKGGLAKLEKQPTNRYFKRKKLADIIMMHGTRNSNEDEGQLDLFVHFLLGILDPDPWKRWTAFQAASHPFITKTNRNINSSSSSSSISPSGGRGQQETISKNTSTIDWVPPWDPSICRRKLLNVQKTREKQQAMRRVYRHETSNDDRLRRGSDNTTPTVVGFSGSTVTSKATTMTEHPGRQNYGEIESDITPPPSLLGISVGLHSSGVHAASASSSMGSVMMQSGPPLTLSDYDYRQGVAADNCIPSSLIMPSGGGMSSYGAMPMSRPIMPSGPQSFSVLSNDSGGYSESEFGYALQRPGVVPSTNEVVGSASSITQGSLSSMSQQNQNAYVYPPSHVASQSLPGVNHVGHSGRNATVPMASGNRLRGRRQSFQHPGHHSFNMHHHMQPTSIREDASDYQLGGGGDASSIASGASLLAQQLEEQAAIARDGFGGGTRTMATMDALQQQHHHLQEDAQPYWQPPIYLGHRQGGAVDGYFTTYITTDGTPLVTSSMDHLQGCSNTVYHQHTGNFSADHRHVPMQQQHMMQQQYVPAPATLHHGGMMASQQQFLLQQQFQQQYGVALEELDHQNAAAFAQSTNMRYQGLSM